MTAQIPDIVQYQSKPYYLYGHAGELPRSPADFGVRVGPGYKTNNLRGYRMVYAVRDERLQLLHIDISGDLPPGKPEIQGVAPVADYAWSLALHPIWRMFVVPMLQRTSYKHVYRNIRLPLPACRGLLVARERAVRLSNPRVSCGAIYELSDVLELHFEEGKVVGVTEHAERASRWRQHDAQAPAAALADPRFYEFYGVQF